MNYQKQWEFLKNNFESNKLVHAFLFSGQDFDLMKNFAKELIKLINCNEYQKPCGKCQNCLMIERGSFPDLIVIKSSDSENSIKSEKDMMEISVEQVRNAQDFLGYKSYCGNFKSVIVENAERMNLEAQSCFLKTLEEPRGKTVIFLLSSKPDFLLPTIFSRCQQIKFFYNGKYEILKDEKNILLDLQKIIDSDLAEKFNYAKSVNLEEGNFNKILNVLQKHFRQLLLAKIGTANSQNQIYPIVKLIKVLKAIEKLRYQASIYNVNKKLALEILLMEI